MLWSDGQEPTPTGAFASWFLETPATGGSCPGAADEYLWLQGLSPGSGMPDFAGGNAVHLITRETTSLTETVSLIGGIEHGGDDDACTTIPSHGKVIKIVDPSPGTGWADSGAPDLPEPRVNCNTVILPNGELLVIGGTTSTGSECIDQRHARLMRPAEVFGSNSTGWLKMDRQQHRRNYHSVALLLIDGRVLSAGSAVGQGRHSVEVYSPWYYFEPRPELVNPPATGVLGDTSSPFEVKFRSGFESPTPGVSRFALLRPGSVTHAFDSNQRYIELESQEVMAPQGQPAVGTYRVTWPSDETTAPRGWYLLTAVDLGDRPSVMSWVRIL